MSRERISTGAGIGRDSSHTVKADRRPEPEWGDEKHSTDHFCRECRDLYEAELARLTRELEEARKGWDAARELLDCHDCREYREAVAKREAALREQVLVEKEKLLDATRSFVREGLTAEHRIRNGIAKLEECILHHEIERDGWSPDDECYQAVVAEVVRDFIAALPIPEAAPEQEMPRIEDHEFVPWHTTDGTSAPDNCAHSKCCNQPRFVHRRQG